MRKNAPLPSLPASLQEQSSAPGAVDVGSSILPAIAKFCGKNLACWCRPGQPCLADGLLKRANAEPVAIRVE